MAELTGAQTLQLRVPASSRLPIPVSLLQTVFSVVSDAQLEGEGKGSLKAPQGTPESKRTLKALPAGLSSLLSHLLAASRCT